MRRRKLPGLATCLLSVAFCLSVGSVASKAQTVLVGDAAIESNIDTNPVGRAEAFQSTAAASGSVGSINVFLDPSSTATKIYVGIYSDNNGQPGSLLTQGSSTTLYAGTWNTITISSVSVTSGKAYWMAILGTAGGAPVFRDRTISGTSSRTSSQTNLTSLPSTFTTGKTWSTNYLSAYAVSSTYPATVVLGNQAVESYLDKNPTGRAEAFPATANTTATVGTIALYLDPTSGSGPVYAGLYSDNGGKPGTLLGQGSTSNPVPGSWNQISITSSNITAGSKYWIAVLGTTATSPYFRDRQTTICESQTTTQTNLTSLPSAWTTGATWQTCYISAYALPASGSPVLSLNASTLSFSAVQGGANPASQNLSLTNTGTGTLSFTVATDQSWLTATPSSGTAPQTIQVSAAVAGLAPGTHTGHVTITAAGAQGSPATVAVTFVVNAAIPPSISYSLSPAPDAAGWDSASVTVTFACTAGTYPIQSCTAPVVVSAQGAGQTANGTAIDTSGNSSTVTATVNIDETAPTITATVSPAPVNGINYGSATVTFTCSDALSGIANCPSPVTDSTVGPNQIISGTAVDKAGNTKSASVTLNIQAAVPPTITYALSPAPNANGWNNSTVTVTFTCTAGSYPIQSCSSPATFTTQGLGQTATGTAKDTNGLTGTATATVNIDTTPPAITATISPAPVNGINYGSATVTFTCSDALSGVATCPDPVTVTTLGSGQVINRTAVDKAGNSSSTSATLNIQAAVPPSITATISPAPNANGWNNSVVTVTFNCTAGSYPVKACSSPVTVNTEGPNQPFPGTVTDSAGQSASTTATVSVDLTPPTISQFTAPSQLAPGQSGTASVTASDNFTLSSVVIQLNGTAIATLTAPPYSASFTIPSTATSGATYTLTAVATDEAGNTTPSSHGVQVVAAGVVVGQVLFDQTGLPFPGAAVQIVGTNGQDTTDAAGTYTIPSNASQVLLSITAAGNGATGSPAMIPVQRFVAPQNGIGTVAVDARLTPIAAPTSINSSTGGSLQSGSVSVAVAAGSIASATNFHLTSLSQQGLPELLPLGWSPVVAFDLRSDTTVSASFAATFTQLPNSITLHLVSYNYAADTWTMIAPNLTANSGSLKATLPSLGSYALVTADLGNTTLVVPSAGQALSGVAMVPLPAGSTASGSLNPPSVSPTGGTSVATLAVQSSVPLPSGTVIQASVLETYNLASGTKLSDPQRTEDLLLYQYAAPPGAAAVTTFPVTPSQTFQPGQLSSGDVHLDILSGRESVRGAAGGNDPVVVTGGDATLTVSAGSLPQDTAISVNPESTNSFLPATATIIPLAEYNLDFSGLTLNIPAQLSVAAGAANPGDNVFLAQIVRLAGAPYIVVVSQAQVVGTAMTTQSVAGLPGVTQGGDYIFYKVTQPAGFVSGTVSSSSGPLASLVQTDGLPFVVFTGTSGTYFVPALAGGVNLTASVPNTALSGTTAVTVTAGQTATANITVVGQVETATVTPANGSVGVPLTAEIDVTAKDAFNIATVTATSVTLTQIGQGTSTSIPVRFVFLQDNTKLAVFPVTALQPSTTYTFAASGLANALGGLTTVPTITFTTQAVIAPNFNTSALVFAMPDQNGNVAISAPANSFPPGSTILIVDQTNGVVLSLTVANDGSVTGKMPATIDDVLAVTITAPDKTTASFTISKFVAADGTTAIGPGGGTVTGPGNTGIIIPAGGLNKGTTFKIDLLDQTAFPQLPAWQGANFASGMRITAPAMPSFNQEAKLAFPVPSNAPLGAFFYVYRRLVDANNPNNVLFETIDHAFVQGTGANAQVVTASPPFCGYMNSFGNFQAVANAGFQPLTAAVTYFFMFWDLYDPNQAGVASQGTIVGRVFETDSSGNPVPLPSGASASIWLTNNPQYVTTTTPSCGTYALFDPQFGGGTRSVSAKATVPVTDPVTNQTANFTQTIVSTTTEVDGAQPNDSLFSVTAGLERQYRNIGRLNFTFAPPTPPPPPPQIIIGVYTLNGGTRQPISGIVPMGTPLTITFSSTLDVQAATVNGVSPSSVTSDSVSNPVQGYNYSKLSSPYTPTSPGVYTIVAKGLNPLNPSTALSVSRSFLVVAAGVSNNQPTSNAPFVAGTTPDPSGQNVPVSVFPSITFSEPVQNVVQNLCILDAEGNAPQILLFGIDNNLQPVPSVAPNSVLTSLTIQPVTGLKFGEKYTIYLNSGAPGANCQNAAFQSASPKPSLITDLNNKILDPNQDGSNAPYQLSFTTFGPQQLGSSSSQYELLTRPVIIGQRAYVGEFVNTVNSGLGIFNITNPTKPKDLGVPVTFVGRAVDAVGLANSPADNGGALVAVSSSTAQDVAIPANVWLYDVSTPNLPVRVGAVSVTSSADQAGIAVRLAMKNQYLYASTMTQGLQVIDLGQALAEYAQVYGNNPTQFGQAVSTDGNGFAMDTIVNDIQLPVSNGATALMFGLQPDDFVTTGGGSGTSAATQTLLVATGQLPFVMVDPTLSGLNAVLYPANSGGLLSKTPPQMQTQYLNPDGSTGTTTYQLQLGRAVAVTTIPYTDTSGNTTNKHVAVVVGTGSITSTSPSGLSASGTPLLVVVDISGAYSPGASVTCAPNAATGSPNCPLPLGFLRLLDQNNIPVSATDITINGTTALIATGTNVLLVDLANPYQPASAGQLTGTFGNWLAVTSSNMVVGTAPTSAGIPGLNITALVPVAFVSDYTPNPIPTAFPTPPPANPNLFVLQQDVALTHVVVPPDPAITTDRVDIIDDLGSKLISFSGSLSDGEGTVIWQKVQNTQVDLSRTYSAQVYAVKNGVPLQSFPVELQFQCPKCTVPPLAPLTDSLSISFENGQPPDTQDLQPQMQTGLTCLQNAITNAGGTPKLKSAYRPSQYQAHLREVFDKHRLLKLNNSPECKTLKAQVEAEFKKHELGATDRVAGPNGPHTTGSAFDLTTTGIPNIDTLANQCHLRRPYVHGDPAHFEHQ